MMSRHNTFRLHGQGGLDEEQTKDAMKVLEKFVRKKYRNSILVGTNEFDLNTSELLTPQSPPLSGFHFPSRQITIDEPAPGSHQGYGQTYTFNFTEHSVKEEIKFHKEKETKIAYIARVLQYFYNNFGLKHVLLVLILICYALVGGFLFMIIELPAQQKADHEFLQDCVQRHTNLAKEVLQILQTSGCLKKLQTQSDSESQTLHENSQCSLILRPLLQSYDEMVRKVLIPQDPWKWDYWNSVFYAGTIFTTIGYGNITCTTPIGRVMTILYALFGIPLMLAVLNVIGKALFGRAQMSYMLLRRFLRSKWHSRKARHHIHHQRAATFEAVTSEEMLQKKESAEQFSDADDSGLFETFPMSLALFIIFLYIILCSVVFSIWEQWDLFTAVYFSFISLSTVGFGDVIPEHPRYACVLFAFYFVGLALFSMCYAIIQVRWENQYMWALQLIDQEQQEQLETSAETEEKESELPESDVSSIRWRSGRRGGPHTEEEQGRQSVPEYRYSAVLLNSKDSPVVPPPVLGVFIARSISNSKNQLARSDSSLSKRISRILIPSSNSEAITPQESKSQWPSASTDVSVSPGPYGPRPASSATNPAQWALQIHTLSAINETSDEETLHSRQNSRMKVLNRQEAVRTETPSTPMSAGDRNSSSHLTPFEFHPNDTTTKEDETCESISSAQSPKTVESHSRLKPPTTLNLRYKYMPADK